MDTDYLPLDKSEFNIPNCLGYLLEAFKAPPKRVITKHTDFKSIKDTFIYCNYLKEEGKHFTAYCELVDNTFYVEEF